MAARVEVPVSISRRKNGYKYWSKRPYDTEWPLIRSDHGICEVEELQRFPERAGRIDADPFAIEAI